MSEGVIPARVEGETPKAYSAFVDYCQMGQGRSLSKLHRNYTERIPGDDPPTRHIYTLKRWSTDNYWQERAAEYERRAAEQREQERQRQRIEWEARTVQRAERFEVWLDGRWLMVEQSPKSVTAYQAHDLVKLAKAVDDLGRRSLGLPNAVSESTVKGTGKGGAVKVERSGSVNVYIPENGRDDREQGD